MAMKRRLSDYLQTNHAQVSKDNSVPLFKTQKVSFKLFQQKETPHMKAAYPFLTKAQINAKIRQLWKNMKDHEKQNFSKIVLTKTPTKSEKNAMQSGTRKCVKGGKQKGSIWKEFQSKQSPLYKSDFNSPQPVEQRKSSPVWLTGSPGTQTHVIKDYSKIKFQPDYVVPEVIDDTPSIQPGILRQRELNNESEETLSTKKKNRVSFSPKKIEENTSPATNSAVESSPGYSSEEDCTLIRRDSKYVCDFDEIENFSMCIESDDPTKLKQKKDSNDEAKNASEKMDINTVMSDELSIESENKSDFPEMKTKTAKEERKSVKGKKNRHNINEKKVTPEILSIKITRSTPNAGKIKSDIEQYTTPLVLKPQNDQYISKSDKEKYTTPMMDDATMKQLIEQAKKAPKKRESSRHKSLTKEDDEKELFKKPRARTSLLAVQRDDDEDMSIVDASGDAKMIADENKENMSEKEDKDLDLPMNLYVTSPSDDHNSDGSETLMIDVDIPLFPTKGNYFKLPDKPQDMDLSESEDDSVFEACKTTSNSTVQETLKRMKEALMKCHSPVNSPTVSPKILSPALSGISQLSSVSSDSFCSLATSDSLKETTDKTMDDNKENKEQKRIINLDVTHKKQGISESDTKNNKTPISNKAELTKKADSKVKTAKLPDGVEIPEDMLSDCHVRESVEDKTNKVCVTRSKVEKIKKITRFATRSRMSPTEVLMRKDKPLCELFYDLTPPEQKQLKSSNRRLVASAVTPGKSNFSSLFDTHSESIF